MKNSLLFCLGIGLSVSTASSLSAQTPAPPKGAPPRILQILREDVKPGKSAAHQKYEAGWPRAFAKANWPTSYLAMTSITGPSEAWFMTGYESFGAWQKDRENLDRNEALRNEDDRLVQGDAEFLSASRSIVAAYREDLSYTLPVQLPKMRFFRVVTFRVRPGHDSDFMEATKVVRAGYEKANIETGFATYQIVSGMPTPTYLVLVPMRSLDEIDASMMKARKVQEAEGEDDQKKMAKLAAAGYLSIESNLYVLDPKISYPSKDFIAADPEFWNPKPSPSPRK